MKPPLLLLFLGLQLTVMDAFSQNFVMNGQLQDSVTKEPLTFATVYNANLKLGVISSSSGRFTLPVVYGQNLIQINHVGCDVKRIQLRVSQSFDTLITMAHHQHELDNVTISADKNRLIAMEKNSVKKDDLMVNIAKPIAAIMDNLPGVYSLKTGFSIAKPIIQGMYGSRVGIINHGLKQEGQQWGLDHGLEIDPFNTSQMMLIKGAEALRYTGDAIGGLVLVEPHFNPNDTLHTTLTSAFASNGLQGHLGLSFQNIFKKNIAYRIQASVKKSGDLKTPTYYLPNTGFEEQNANFELRWHKNKRSQFEFSSSLFRTTLAILSTSHIGNLSDLLKIINQDTVFDYGKFSYTIGKPNQKITHSLSKVKWKHDFSSSLNLETIYGLQFNRRQEFDIPMTSTSTGPSLDFKLSTQNLDAVLAKKIKSTLLIKTGISVNYQTNIYQGRYFIPNYSKSELHHFSILRYKKNRNEFEFGYHYGSIKLLAYKWVNALNVCYPLQFEGWSWQGGWLYKISHDWQAALQLGKAWRNPNINELFSEGLHHGAAAIEYGNFNLKPEHAHTLSGLLKYRHNKTLFEIEGYGKHIQNYIYLKPKFPPELTIRGAFPAYNYVQTSALVLGIDLLAEQVLPHNWSVAEKISILNVYDKINLGYINTIPPYTFFHTISYMPVKIKKLKNTSLKLTAQHVLKQKRYTDGSDYMAPPNGYVLLNAAFITNFLRYENLRVFLSADNLLNTRYRNYLNRFRYFSDDLGRQVTAGLNLKF